MKKPKSDSSRPYEILLDELSRDLIGHDVKTARQMGWTSIKNGELLALAVAAGFDAFVTVDRNLSFQQAIATFPISVIVLRARSNRLAELRPLLPQLLVRLEKGQRGAVHLVEGP